MDVEFKIGRRNPAACGQCDGDQPHDDTMRRDGLEATAEPDAIRRVLNSTVHGARAFALLGAVVVGSWSLAAAQTAPKPAGPSPAAPAGVASPATKTPQKPKQRDPAEAQRAIDNGVKLLQSGKVEPAISTFSAVIAAGNLPPPLMAKALFHRGQAYRKAGKPAQAISDLQSALWLKGGLVEPERAEAIQARIEAYREAGLPDQSTPTSEAAAEKSARRAKTAADSAATGEGRAPARAPVSPSVVASAAPSTAPAPAPAAPAASSGGASNFFSSLFGGGSSASQPAPAKPAETAAVKAEVGQAWSSITSVKSPRDTGKGAQNASAAAVAPAAPAASAAATVRAVDATGRFRAQVALVRSAAEAQAVVAKLKKDYGVALAKHEPAIDQATLGNMGAFYRVRVGPYATQAEAQTLCSTLKGSGLDCVPVTQ